MKNKQYSHNGHNYRLATEEDIGKDVYYADCDLFYEAVTSEPHKLIEYRKGSLCPYKVENSMVTQDVCVDLIGASKAEYLQQVLHWWECAWIKDENKKT